MVFDVVTHQKQYLLDRDLQVVEGDEATVYYSTRTHDID